MSREPATSPPRVPTPTRRLLQRAVVTSLALAGCSDATGTPAPEPAATSVNAITISPARWISFDDTRARLGATDVQAAIQALAARPGTPGPAGPQGERGPAGGVGSIADLEGTPCGPGGVGVTRFIRVFRDPGSWNDGVFAQGGTTFDEFRLHCSAPEPRVVPIRPTDANVVLRASVGVTVRQDVVVQNLSQASVTIRNVRLTNPDGSPYVGAEFLIEEDICSAWPHGYLAACRMTIAFTGTTAGDNPVATLRWDTSPHSTYFGDEGVFQIHGLTNTF